MPYYFDKGFDLVEGFGAHLRNGDDATIPVDIELGLRIVGFRAEPWTPDNSYIGWLKKPVIHYSKYADEATQRWIIAHLVFHATNNEINEIKCPSEDDELCADADMMAGAWLIPKEPLFTLIECTDDNDTAKLAAAFAVPEWFMAERLKYIRASVAGDLKGSRP
ncbi:MAG: ImmA/IrrE family metallo-endopeptidase [bacterium]|nr:ImmA/IrrE family metallo-endopeptidase [bacterium]